MPLVSFTMVPHITLNLCIHHINGCCKCMLTKTHLCCHSWESLTKPECSDAMNSCHSQVVPAHFHKHDLCFRLFVSSAAVFGVLFSDHQEAAFACYRMFQAIGLALAFGYSHFLCVATKVYIMGGVLIVGLVLYAAIEFRLHQLKKFGAGIVLLWSYIGLWCLRLIKCDSHVQHLTWGSKEFISSGTYVIALCHRLWIYCSPVYPTPPITAALLQRYCESKQSRASWTWYLYTIVYCQGGMMNQGGFSYCEFILYGIYAVNKLSSMINCYFYSPLHCKSIWGLYLWLPREKKCFYHFQWWSHSLSSIRVEPSKAKHETLQWIPWHCIWIVMAVLFIDHHNCYWSMPWFLNSR